MWVLHRARTVRRGQARAGHQLRCFAVPIPLLPASSGKQSQPYRPICLLHPYRPYPQPAWQDFTDNYLSFFYSDEVADLVLMGDFACEFVGQLFAHVLDDLGGPVGQSLQEKLKSYVVATPLVEGLDRLARLGRAVCHIVNVNPDPTRSQPKPDDVQYFLSYGGREALERQWKVWLTNSHDWWTQEVQSIAKVSGKSLLLQPQVQELTDMLQVKEEEWEQHKLLRAIDLYKQIAEGTRDIVHKPLGQQLLEVLTKRADNMLETTGGQLSTPIVDTVLAGLALFSATAGVMTLSQRVREMATEKVADIAAVDL